MRQECINWIQEIKVDFRWILKRVIDGFRISELFCDRSQRTLIILRHGLRFSFLNSKVATISKGQRRFYECAPWFTQKGCPGHSTFVNVTDPLTAGNCLQKVDFKSVACDLIERRGGEFRLQPSQIAVTPDHSFQ
jgi:hypothetical protein